MAKGVRADDGCVTGPRGQASSRGPGLANWRERSILPTVHLGLALLLLTAAGIADTPQASAAPSEGDNGVVRAAMCRSGNLWAEEVEFAEALLALDPRGGQDHDAPLSRCDASGQDPGLDGGAAAVETHIGPPALIHCEGPRLAYVQVHIGRCDMQPLGHPHAHLHGERRHGRGLLSLAGVHRSLHAAPSTAPDERGGDRSMLVPVVSQPPDLAPSGRVAARFVPPLLRGHPTRIDRPPRA